MNKSNLKIGITGVILAGGKNTRMGTNKAFLTVKGERLIERTVRLFTDIFPEIIIVTNTPLEYLDQSVQIVTDIYEGKGALGGIYTGLFHASGSHAFVTACDMPFLHKSFIEYMLECIDGYDIVVPALKEGYQPLHAVYGKNCLPPMKKLILENRLKITAFYRGRRILAINEETIRMFDPAGNMFFNINAPEDLGRISSC
jgi:molybdopterin-guanine dinucleotide biosynthesis protein A